VLSAHVEVHRAVELLSEGRGVGYLLMSRVTEVGDILETLEQASLRNRDVRARGYPVVGDAMCRGYRDCAVLFNPDGPNLLTPSRWLSSSVTSANTCSGDRTDLEKAMAPGGTCRRAFPSG
jgi:hypothetical protein